MIGALTQSRPTGNERKRRGIVKGKQKWKYGLYRKISCVTATCGWPLLLTTVIVRQSVCVRLCQRDCTQLSSCTNNSRVSHVAYRLVKQHNYFDLYFLFVLIVDWMFDWFAIGIVTRTRMRARTTSATRPVPARSGTLTCKDRHLAVAGVNHSEAPHGAAPAVRRLMTSHDDWRQSRRTGTCTTDRARANGRPSTLRGQCHRKCDGCWCVPPAMRWNKLYAWSNWRRSAARLEDQSRPGSGGMHSQLSFLKILAVSKLSENLHFVTQFFFRPAKLGANKLIFWKNLREKLKF